MAAAAGLCQLIGDNRHRTMNEPYSPGNPKCRDAQDTVSSATDLSPEKMAKNMQHPYYPRDLELPHYIPNESTIPEILSGFFGFMAVVVVLTFVYGSSRCKLNMGDSLKLVWFVSCGLIHCIIEGYFSVFHKTFPGQQTFLAQMWKEYSKGDSRYASQDTFVVCMETITAFIDGPLSFLAAYALINKSSYRYPVQLVLSLCQLYGDVLYFSTEFKEGFTHSEMFHPLYFWFYFVFLNALWIFIPLFLIYQAWEEMSAAQSTHDRSGESKKLQ